MYEYGIRSKKIITTMMTQANRGIKNNKETRSRKPTDIHELLETSLQVVSKTKKKQYENFSLEIEQDFDYDLGEIQLVTSEIYQIFTNLIENACDAVFKKKLNINSDFEPKISLRTEKIEQQIKIIIKDNGEGITSELAENIFQPFITGNSGEAGMGIGLYLVKILTEKNQGSISWSRESGWTKFTLTLPVIP